MYGGRNTLTPTLYTHKSRFVPMIITAIGALCVYSCGKEDIKERTGEKRERERNIGWRCEEKGKSLVFVGGERKGEKRRERDAWWETRDRCACVRARARLFCRFVCLVLCSLYVYDSLRPTDYVFQLRC